MRVNAKLAFNGTCEAAFKMYAECFNAEITFMLTYGASPVAETYPGLEDKIFHATLNLANQTLTGADVAAGSYVWPQGFSLQLNVAREEDAQRVFAMLSEGGAVHMPLQKTFWAEHYAVVTDRFGTPWEINGA